MGMGCVWWSPMTVRKVGCWWYGASLGGSKTLKHNILRVFSMSDLINI